MATNGAYSYDNPSGYFPPPPGQEQYTHTPEAEPRDRPDPQRQRSFSQSSFFLPRRRDSRTYAPAEPRPHEGNMVTPYNEDRAEAEYTDAYGPAPRDSEYGDVTSRGPPPPHSAYDYDDESDRRYSQDARDRPYYDDDRYTRGPPSSITDNTRAFDRRRPSRDSPPSTRRRRGRKNGDRDIFRQSIASGERGLASALLGGAAGAWIGHEASHSTLETLSGFAIGAIGGNAIEKHFEKYREKKRRDSHNDRARDNDYYSRSPSFSPRRTQSVRRDASVDSRYSTYSMRTARPRELGPDQHRRRDSRATSMDSKARSRYSGSSASYIDDRR